MSDPYADIERLIEALSAPTVPDHVRDTAAALTDRLLRVHRDALARLVALVDDEAVVDDPEVAPVLLLHQLHPLPIDDRIRRAVDDAVRESAPARRADVVIDAAGATVTLDVAPEELPEVRRAIEQAVHGAAPECPAVRVVAPVAVELRARPTR